MDEIESNGGRHYFGARYLVGHAEDYTDPIHAVMYHFDALLHEYVAQGGDLNQVHLRTAVDRDAGRGHLRIELRGFGWTDGSTAQDASGGSTSTTTS